MRRTLLMLSLSVASLVLLATSTACAGPPACTDLLAFGLNVTVTDAANGERICDATVTATDGDFSETLQPFGEATDCTYAGAGERAGTYTITVEKDGYATLTEDNVVVEEDECHVIGEVLELELAQTQ